MTSSPRLPLSERKRRLTYLMLFRVGVVTLLLGLTVISELATTASQQQPRFIWFLGLIVSTYTLTIMFALWLPRTQRGASLAATQVVADLIMTTVLVYLTGGTESGFAFMYVLVIVGASFVLDGRAVLVAVAAVLLLGAVNALPYLLGIATTSVREMVRTFGYNAVSFAATGALAGRLTVELQRASERATSTGHRLRDLAALHLDVIRSLTSGLVTVVDGQVVTFNAAAESILGISSDTSVGQPVTEILPWLAAMGDTLQGGRDEALHAHPDGTVVPLGVSVSPLVDAEGTVSGRIVSFQDLTDLRRMEVEVARAERLAAIGRLAASLAHEIRNPLAAISGSIELLQQTASSDETNRELMAIVLREVSRLNELVTGMLDFARPARPQLQPVELAQTVAELLRVLENDKDLNGARAELRPTDPVWVDADPGQLRQVLWNLVRNAAQASPTGAPIMISLEQESNPDAVRLEIRDFGSGIPPEMKSRIFEPFFSTKQGGTGLGLATVHRIVEEHRGHISLETPPDGVGTIVAVRLPLRLPPS